MKIQIYSRPPPTLTPACLLSAACLRVHLVGFFNSFAFLTIEPFSATINST